MTLLAQNISAGPVPEAARGLLAAADLPTSDLTDEQLGSFFYCGPANAPTALVGLEIYGNRAVAPAAIRSTKEFAGLCPATSAFMSKRL